MHGDYQIVDAICTFANGHYSSIGVIFTLAIALIEDPFYFLNLCKTYLLLCFFHSYPIDYIIDEFVTIILKLNTNSLFLWYSEHCFSRSHVISNNPACLYIPLSPIHFNVFGNVDELNNSKLLPSSACWFISVHSKRFSFILYVFFCPECPYPQKYFLLIHCPFGVN